MALDYDFLMGLEPMVTSQTLTRKDTILYALGVGAGADAPTDPGELKFVYENGLQALPTQAVVLASPGFWAQEPKYGLTWQKVLHGEQSIELHGALPVEGQLRGVTSFDEIYDKGLDKGAVLYSTRRIYDEGTGREVATVRQCSFLRGDGGFGGKSDGAPRPHPIPNRAADIILTARTRPDQALLYRLSGDSNPLHIDPEVARQGGFAVPILHGLASFGVAGRVLIKALAANEPARLRRLGVRFSSPVIPGETLEVHVWREGDSGAAFLARSPGRGVVVLQNGYLELNA